MPQAIDIRPANAADMSAVAKLIAANFDRAMPEHSPSIREKFKEHSSAEILTGQLAWKEIYVVTSAGEIVATGALADFGTPDAPKWSVSNFFVQPERHGQKIGQTLLRFLIAEARKKDVDTLHVPSSRTALRFYQHYGFVCDGAQPAADVALEITWMTLALPRQSESERNSNPG